MELYAHQKTFLAQNPDKSALIWSCGTGKSLTALMWAREGVKSGKYKSPLVICPKGLKTNWNREGIKAGAPGLSIKTKEEFRRDWEGMIRYDQIIIDEVHSGFLTPQFKSQMSKALKKYLHVHKVPRVLLLSATVYTSSPWNIFNLAYYLGHKWNWLNFNLTYFNQIRMGMRMIPVPKKGCEKKLAEETKKIASVVDIANCMDVPLQQHCEPEYFSFTKGQQKAVKDNYDPMPIVRYTKQHEIENGILIGNDFVADKTFGCDKDERLLQLVAENLKIAIVCRYNLQLEHLAGLLRDYSPSIISGKTKNRDKVCLDAEKADRAVVLIQADCGIGFQLPSFGLCVYASMSYSYTAWEQMNGRFLRMDKPSRTTFIYLLTEGDSIDQAVYDSVGRKEDFSIALYGK